MLNKHGVTIELCHVNRSISGQPCLDGHNTHSSYLDFMNTLRKAGRCIEINQTANNIKVKSSSYEEMYCSFYCKVRTDSIKTCK